MEIKMIKWTEIEIEKLKKCWMSSTRESIQKMFISRSWKSLKRKAECLRLTRLRFPYQTGKQCVILNLPSWFVGELLGDGSISKEGRYCHTNKHREYIEFLKNKMNLNGYYVWIKDNKYFDLRTSRYYYRTVLKTYSVFKNVRQQWYPFGKKRVPLDIRIDEEVLLHWIMGDGSISKNGQSFRLATGGFDRESILILKSKLEEKGINCSIISQNNINILKTDKSRAYFKNFIKQNKGKFPNCYLYKLIGLENWVLLSRGGIHH
jgi:hypothetical protein